MQVIATNDSYAVNDTDRVKLTCCYTVAQADATVRALLAAAEKLLGSLTGSDIFILIKLGGIVCRAVAHNKRHFFLHVSGILAEQGSELFGNSRTTDRAFRAGGVTTLSHCMRIVVTSCVSAAAAVGAGKLCAKIKEELILLYCKNL